MLKSKYIGLLFLVLAILMACQYPSPVTSSEDMPQKTRDSVNYLVERHYTLNSNFEVTSDSLMLQQLPLVDVLPVFKGERLVVAEFMIQPADSVDSVWVKVARDQETMGWVHEKELLEKVVPVDSVSQFIHFFSNSHTIAFFIILGFFGIWYVHRAIRRQKLQLIWLNDIDSVFPTVLSWLVATYNPQIQISAESETKRSIFREKDKTKRSKKESAQHSKSRNKSFVMTSVSAL
jgi:hypothetical protein